MLSEPDAPGPAEQALSTPIILLLIAICHLLYPAIIDLRRLPYMPPALALSLLLAGAYTVVAWMARRGRGFRPAVNLIVGEDLGVLASGILLGYPWADYLRPGTVAIIALQLALAFAEIVRRQEARRPIVAGSRLAWFVVAYAAAFTAYALLRPAGIWSLEGTGAP